MKTVAALKLSFIFVFVNGESEVTLTTATVCESECLKPTSLHSRIFSDRNTGDSRRTPSYFIRSRKQDRRLKRSRSELWKWDYWCQLQPKMGNCSEKLPKFYYDTQLDRCVTFTYRGCNGNKNSFDTLVDCERHCKGSAFMKTREMESAASCALQPNAGLCVALYTKYYYDVNEATCKRFVFGGCGGNENRFNTKRKCLKRCSIKK